MHPDFQRLMQDATRLVRAGDLQAATTSIQTALHGHLPAGAATFPLPAAAGHLAGGAARGRDAPPAPQPPPAPARPRLRPPPRPPPADSPGPGKPPFGARAAVPADWR